MGCWHAACGPAPYSGLPTALRTPLSDGVFKGQVLPDQFPGEGARGAPAERYSTDPWGRAVGGVPKGAPTTLWPRPFGPADSQSRTPDPPSGPVCVFSLPISCPRGSRWAAAVRRPPGGIFVGESLGADLTQSMPYQVV